MKKKLMLLASILVAALVTSCSTVQVASSKSFNGMKLSPKGESVAHVTASSSGMYLVIFPLITGSSKQPGMPALFEDSCKVPAMTEALTREAAKLDGGNGKTIDVVSTQNSTVMPIFPLPIFFWKTATVSGNVVK